MRDKYYDLVKIIFYLCLLLWAISCQNLPKKNVNAGYQDEEKGISFRASHCLRNFLIGEDAGGEWTIIEKPITSTLLQSELDGTDNPCIDFADYGCGVYRLQYLVSDICCRDSTIIKVNKKCCNISGTLICN